MAGKEDDTKDEMPKQVPSRPPYIAPNERKSPAWDREDAVRTPREDKRRPSKD